MHTHICYFIMVGTFYWLLLFSHCVNYIFFPLTLKLTLMDTFLHFEIFIKTLFSRFIKSFPRRDNLVFLKSLYYKCRGIRSAQCRQNQTHMHTYRLMQRHTTCFSKGGAVLEFTWQCCIVENVSANVCVSLWGNQSILLSVPLRSDRALEAGIITAEWKNEWTDE